VAESGYEVGDSDSSLADLGRLHDPRQRLDSLARRLRRLSVRQSPTQDHHLKSTPPTDQQSSEASFTLCSSAVTVSHCTTEL